MKAWALPLVAALALAGCQETRPSGATEPIASSQSETAAPSASASVKPASNASSAPNAPPAPSGSSPVPVGGPWVRCYAHFRPSSTPARDVRRLALLCGPENGMHPLAEIVEDTISETPIEHHVHLEQGECVRVFAAADANVDDLDVALLSPHGETLAVDAIDDRWPVLQPDRPVCVTEAGSYTIRLHTRKGTGHSAMQAWVLP